MFFLWTYHTWKGKNLYLVVLCSMIISLLWISEKIKGIKIVTYHLWRILSECIRNSLLKITPHILILFKMWFTWNHNFYWETKASPHELLDFNIWGRAKKCLHWIPWFLHSIMRWSWDSINYRIKNSLNVHVSRWLLRWPLLCKRYVQSEVV